MLDATEIECFYVFVPDIYKRFAMPRLNPQIDPPYASIIAPETLLALEKMNCKPLIHIEYFRDGRLVWMRHALLDQGTVKRLTGAQNETIRKWADRGQLPIARMLGSVRLFNVGAVEHMLATREFPRNDEWCEAGWMAHAFFAWVPRDGLKAAPGSPAKAIEEKPFMPSLYDFVNERLTEVEQLRRANIAAQAAEIQADASNRKSA